MKLVIDTNIVVSAVLRDRLPERVLLTVIGNANWHWIVSVDLLAEYEKVIRRRRLAITFEEQEEWLALIRKDTVQITPATPSLEFARDRNDIHVLHTAAAAEADFLITGDKDFAEAQKLIVSRILTVRQFADRFNIS